MKRFHLSLRIKLTAIVAGVMTICCMLLTAVSISASARLVDALPLQEPIATEELAAETTAAVHCEPAQLATQAQETFQLQNLAAMALVIVVGSAVAYLLVSRQLKPLEQLAASVKTLDAEHMEPEAVPLPNTRDESYQLAAALREMTGRVGGAYRMQKEFAASAAHELRTPLAAMQSRLEVFRMKERTPEEYKALLGRFDGNLARMNALVEQLLQLCSNRQPELCRKVDLRQRVEQAAQELAQAMEQKNIHLEVTGSAFADENDALYGQLVLNLLQNAVKYGGKMIRVSLRNSKNQAELRVEDDGPGLLPEERERVFEPFYRVDRSRSREIGGNGLGLAIVQRIARQYGGSVCAESSALGGACFVVRLPFQLAEE